MRLIKDKGLRAKSVPQYSKLSPQELDAIAAPFDRGEFKTSPLTAADRERHRRAKARGRKSGRPVVGKGAEKIRVSMERGLLHRADSFAKQHGLSRSQLIAQGVELRIKSA
jgi:hypothetical protein